MEDILKFLLIAAILIVAFVRQARKEAQKKAPQKTVPPISGETSPLPDYPEESGTYGGYIPEGPASEPAPSPILQPRSMPSSEGQRTTKERQPQKSDKATPPRGKAAEDFRIHSAEEARRALIWSEILTRKY